ncbi:MAG: FkbM family methyltransferase [Anaerolineales bacterium]
MKVCIVPRVSGVGGMVSFRDRLVAVFEQQGVSVTQELDDLPYQAVLVIGGTRHLRGLWEARRRGIPIVQRLDGMNWLHRLPKSAYPPSTRFRQDQPPSSGGRLRFSLRHILRAELANFNLALIRRYLATTIVYQSQFARQWWERVYGATHQPQRVIYNGVNLSLFSPYGEHQRPSDRLRILMVEGSLGGGYEWGLQVAVGLVEELRALQTEWIKRYPQGVELMVVGQVAEHIRQAWEQTDAEFIRWQGRVAPAEIPFLDRSAHILYSADVHPACPNAVIEALACGLPVLAFATGALPELVTAECGRVVPYGGDAWRLEQPDIPVLARAGVEIALQQERMRQAARARAEAYFDVEAMAKAYAEVLEIPLTPSTGFRQAQPTSTSASSVWRSGQRPNPSPTGRGERNPSNSPRGQGGRLLWVSGIGKLSRWTPLALKRLVYRLPWLAAWLRQRVNRSVGQGPQWVEITAGGLRGLSLYLDLSQEKDYWLGTYEPDLQTAIQELVRPGQVAYDVGANVGYVTLLLARRVGQSGKVIAFEPFPENVERLKQNLSANANLAPMEVVAAAVVDKTGTVTFLVGPSDDTGHVADASEGEMRPGKTLTVEGIALDGLVFEQGYPPPQVIKLDIEGGEVTALRGMRRLLSEVHPLLLLETHSQACAETVWELLTQAGYRVCWMKKGYPSLDKSKPLPRRAYLAAFPATNEGKE